MGKSRKKFPPRRCELPDCGEDFDPKTENQKFCSKSCKQLAWAERKFEQAVQAEVDRRLRDMGITTDKAQKAIAAAK